MTQEDVLGLEITVDDLVLLEKIQRAEHLLRHAPNQLQGEATECVGFYEFVEIHVQQFGRDTEMSTEVEALSKVDHAVLVLRVLRPDISNLLRLCEQ